MAWQGDSARDVKDQTQRDEGGHNFLTIEYKEIIGTSDSGK